MCRIFITYGAQQLGEAVLAEEFARLEKDGGGDGNGIAWFENGKSHIEKGVNLSTKECASIACAVPDGIPILFHTRKASAGTAKSDDLCHPFDCGDGLILAHNGSWGEYKDAWWALLPHGYRPKELISASDTRIMSWLVREYGDYCIEFSSTGVWVLFSPDSIMLDLKAGMFKMGFINNVRVYSTSLPDIAYPKFDGQNGTWANLKSGGPECFSGGFTKIVPSDACQICETIVNVVEIKRGSISRRICFDCIRNRREDELEWPLVSASASGVTQSSVSPVTPSESTPPQYAGAAQSVIRHSG